MYAHPWESARDSQLKLKHTFQLTKDVFGSKPREGLVTWMSELHGCVQSKLHLIYPMFIVKQWVHNPNAQ